MIFADSIEELNGFPAPAEGDRALVRAEGSAIVYDYIDGQWKPSESTLNTGISVYDINRQLIKSMPEIDYEDASYKEIFKRYIEETNNKFYMMLCHDIKYFTLFHKNGEGDLMEDEIMDILKDIDFKIRSIAPDENNSGIEIWFDDHVAYFFGYDLGVVPCK